MNMQIKILSAVAVGILFLFAIVFRYYQKRGFWYPFRDWRHVDRYSDIGPKALEVRQKYKELQEILKTKGTFSLVETSLYDWQILLLVLRGLQKKCSQSSKNVKAKREYAEFQGMILEILKAKIELSWKISTNYFILHQRAIWQLSCKVFPQEMLVELLEKEATNILTLTNKELATECARMFVLFYDSKKHSINGLFPECDEIVETLRVSFLKMKPSNSTTSNSTCNIVGTSPKFDPRQLRGRKNSLKDQRKEGPPCTELDRPSMFKAGHSFGT